MSIGGFFGTTPIQSGGFANNGPTMQQATNETLNVAAGLPEPIAQSMLFGLGIAQWGARPENKDIFDQPEFVNAYNGLFGPNQNQVGRASNIGGMNDIRSVLAALLSRLGIR